MGKREQAVQRVRWLASQLGLEFEDRLPDNRNCAIGDGTLEHHKLAFIITDRKKYSFHHQGQFLNGEISVAAALETRVLIDDDWIVTEEAAKNGVLVYQVCNRS